MNREYKSAEEQAIEYLKKKQDKEIDHMDRWQMYRFAIDALTEKNKRNKGCDCCKGDEALWWDDEENNVFVDSKGDMLVTVKGKTVGFKVKCCPNCGKAF